MVIGFENFSFLNYLCSPRKIHDVFLLPELQAFRNVSLMSVWHTSRCICDMWASVGVELH